ncbi:MAG TPA: hypothetical protein VFV10_06220 [Gammaproteobacteria bacterium]|nr:hypothetical protein [Gammaproteobacteria bacterium]
MIPAWFLDRAARLLNRQLEESVSAARAAAELEGRSCRVAIEGLSLDFAMRIEGGRVVLGPPRGGEDVSVEGTPFDLFRLLRKDAIGRARGARVSGEVRTAEKFAELLKLAAPDIEEELSGWVGDVAAHALGEAVRRAGGWAVAAATAMRDNAAEYLKEERRLLPSPHEAEELYAGVDRLRDDVERAAARLDRIAALVRED